MKQAFSLLLLCSTAFSQFYVLGSASMTDSGWKNNLGPSFGGSSGTWVHGNNQSGYSAAIGAMVTKSKEEYPASIIAEMGYKHLGSTQKHAGSSSVSIKSIMPYLAAGLSQKFKWHRISFLLGYGRHSLDITNSDSLDISSWGLSSSNSVFMSARVQHEIFYGTNFGLEYNFIPGKMNDLHDSNKTFKPNIQQYGILLQYAL